MAEGILNTIMGTLKDIEKDESTLIAGEGGDNIDLFKDNRAEPEVWEVSRETFSNLDERPGSDVDVFLQKGLSLASMRDEPENIVEEFDSGVLEAMGKSSGQKISTLIDKFSSVSGGETFLKGTTKSGKNYKFNLINYVDEDTGKMVYEINGDRFDEDNYNATIENITEKLDSVSFAVSEKFETKEGALSAEEYISSAKQEPKITVGEPYYSEREEKKKPWWQ